MIDLIESYNFLPDTVPKKEKSYIIEYYVSGVFSVISRWLSEDRTQSIDKMAKMIYRLTSYLAPSKKPNEDPAGK